MPFPTVLPHSSNQAFHLDTLDITSIEALLAKQDAQGIRNFARALSTHFKDMKDRGQEVPQKKRIALMQAVHDIQVRRGLITEIGTTVSQRAELLTKGIQLGGKLHSFN